MDSYYFKTKPADLKFEDSEILFEDYSDEEILEEEN